MIAIIDTLKDGQNRGFYVFMQQCGRKSMSFTLK